MFSAHKKLILLAVLGLIGLIAIAVTLLLTGITIVDLKTFVIDTSNTLLEFLRNAGPVLYFLAFSTLPAIGIPVSLFNLSVAPAFAPTLGLPLVLLLTAVSILLNLLLSYWLARYILRPLVERLVNWLGYKLPDIDKSDHLTVTLLVRLTPGPPYFIQHCLLGLAQVSLPVYLAVSWIITYAYALAFIFLTDSITNGNFTRALAALSFLVVLALVIRLIRKRLSKQHPHALPINNQQQPPSDQSQ